MEGLEGAELAPMGRYRLVARLARGGQAELFLAVSRGVRGVSKLVVLKRLLATEACETDLMQMFLDEAQLAVRLNHPNVIHTYEVGDDGAGQLFIVMEYLEGESLGGLIRAARERERATAPVVWAWIVCEVLAGLAYAHELTDYDGTPLGIVHRDVSPHNVFVTQTGEVKLVDFGVAKAKLNRSVTQEGILKGKLRYMAPEHLLGNAEQRSDIFSIGNVLWEALTGKVLFEGDDPRIVFSLLQDAIPRVSSVKPDIDPELDDIVARALAREPGDRFASAAEMREALLAFVRSTSGRDDLKGEVAKLMDDLFAEHRAEVRRGVKESLAAADSATLPTITALQTVPALPLARAPIVFEPSSGTTSKTRLPVSMPASTAPPRTTIAKRTGHALLGGAVMGAVAALIVFATRAPGSSKSLESVPPPEPVPLASAAAPGTAPTAIASVAPIAREPIPEPVRKLASPAHRNPRAAAVHASSPSVSVSVTAALPPPPSPAPSGIRVLGEEPKKNIKIIE